MYALEEIAKEAKGYVHFVLGNHEIMNMNGDFRYVHPRYMEHAKMMNVPYISFYWDNTELGGWLRAPGLELEDLTGLTYHPLTRAYALDADDVSVNYMVCARRPGHA